MASSASIADILQSLEGYANGSADDQKAIMKAIVMAKMVCISPIPMLAGIVCTYHDNVVCDQSNRRCLHR
jgi:hypothetical protein